MEPRERCGGKVRYQTSKEAGKIADSLNRKYDGLPRWAQPEEEMDIYPCLRCNGWHLTSK